MARVVKSRGYYGVGIERGKNTLNIGTLWRSSFIFGAAFIFTIGKRYPQQASDTVKAWRHVPMMEFSDADDFLVHRPFDCSLVVVELDAKSKPLGAFDHPERAVYVLGAEDHGVSAKIRDKAQHIVQLPGDFCLNVAVAGSIVQYDRSIKTQAN
jgi:tRNA G18 (ribose-2'-O)-methylase SpoU